MTRQWLALTGGSAATMAIEHVNINNVEHTKYNLNLLLVIGLAEERMCRLHTSPILGPVLQSGLLLAMGWHNGMIRKSG